MALTLSDLVTVETLRRLAGPRSFERGEEYARVGAVGALDVVGASIRAGVQGTERYRVRVDATREGIQGDCSCPVGRDGGFCKHCVAVGLAWLGRSHEIDDESFELPQNNLEQRLASLGADALAHLLVEYASQDERIHVRLLATTAAVGAAPGSSFGRVKHAFDLAIEPGGFVGWNEAFQFVQGLEAVIDEVEKQRGPGDGAAVVTFCEHALRKVESSFDYVDDSNGELGGVKERLEELHHRACVEARPDPAGLAERLLSWELESESDTFLGAVERYADVLGEVGLARYRELAYAAWAAEPEVGPDHRSAWNRRRYSLSQIIESLTWLALGKPGSKRSPT
jgi:SWIM zinc finger